MAPHDPSPTLLFAYGTLGPATPDETGWEGDAVRGRLYDLGTYPGLFDLNDPTAGWVEGHVRAVGAGELAGRLDAYEGVDEGLFRREATTTRAGRRAWVYLYARPRPQWARGPLARWERPRG
jgi:gamma-glutamylcyclotransferase (GGCT)/AIG2-like uncharacterized protein YtfP